jgi:hypothetical protein
MNFAIGKPESSQFAAKFHMPHASMPWQQGESEDAA